MAQTEGTEQRILIDTNIFLETLLKQERANECIALLELVEKGLMRAFVTSFALHSIEIAMYRVGELEELGRFLKWVVNATGLTVYPTSPEEERDAITVIKELSLDFDDALQYHVAQTTGLELVSFDQDFDDTGIGRVEPDEVVRDFLRIS